MKTVAVHSSIHHCSSPMVFPVFVLDGIDTFHSLHERNHPEDLDTAVFHVCTRNRFTSTSVGLSRSFEKLPLEDPKSLAATVVHFQWQACICVSQALNAVQNIYDLGFTMLRYAISHRGLWGASVSAAMTLQDAVVKAHQGTSFWPANFNHCNQIVPQSYRVVWMQRSEKCASLNMQRVI